VPAASLECGFRISSAYLAGLVDRVSIPARSDPPQRVTASVIGPWTRSACGACRAPGLSGRLNMNSMGIITFLVLKRPRSQEEQWNRSLTRAAMMPEVRAS
jgi:hypothetical protein